MPSSWNRNEKERKAIAPTCPVFLANTPRRLGHRRNTVRLRKSRIKNWWYMKPNMNVCSNSTLPVNTITTIKEKKQYQKQFQEYVTEMKRSRKQSRRLALIF